MFLIGDTFRNSRHQMQKCWNHKCVLTLDPIYRNQLLEDTSFSVQRFCLFFPFFADPDYSFFPRWHAKRRKDTLRARWHATARENSLAFYAEQQLDDEITHDALFPSRNRHRRSQRRRVVRAEVNFYVIIEESVPPRRDCFVCTKD